MKRYIYTLCLLAGTLALHAEDSILVSQADLKALIERVERLEQCTTANAQGTAQKGTEPSQQMASADAKQVEPTEVPRAHRLSVGGYGEAVMTRNFYSDHFNRYSDPTGHASDKSNGQFDLPHVVVNLGYDFGHGWSFGSEIEFEHGGTESAVEIDADEYR